jgi:hypothetical protein
MLKPKLYRLIQNPSSVLRNTLLTTFCPQTDTLFFAFHPLNPIEMIWSQVKRWVASRKVTFKTEEVIV